jgi:hypothetical protein
MDRLDHIFEMAVIPTEVAISDSRRVQLEAGYAWRSCLRSEPHGLREPHAYVVFVEDGKLVHHEPARPEHGCQSERFERLME